MFAAILDPGVATFVVFIASVLYFVATFLIFRGSRPLEIKLLVLGLVTAIVAVWFGQVGGDVSAGIQMRPGEAGRVVVGGDGAGMLGRIALVLILGGIALAFMNRSETSPLPPEKREEGVRDLSV